MKSLLIAAFAVLALAAVAQTPAAPKARGKSLADSAQQKFTYIQQNGAKPKPDPRPVWLTEAELNAWLASGYVRLPKGVRSVHLTSPGGGEIDGTARVDFDELTAGQRSSNPLLSLFTGIHNIEAQAHGQADGGRATVHIDSVSIDGVGVPRIALEFFIEHYLKPKYPQAGLDSNWRLPNRIDTARAQTHRLVITQK